MSKLSKPQELSEPAEVSVTPAPRLIRLGGGRRDTNAASGEKDELDNGARFD